MMRERERIVKAVGMLMGDTGLSSSALALKAGIAASTLNRFLYRDPDYILSQKTLNSLCRSAGYESYESFVATRFNHEYVRKVRVSAYVGDGGEVHPYSDTEKGPDAREVDCPPGLNPARVVAIRVKGESLLPVLHPGWVVFYTDDQDAVIPILRDGWQVPYNERTEERLSEFYKKPCIVRLKDGRTMLRILKKGYAPGTFNLTAHNGGDIENAEVEWAAKIVYIKTT